MHAFFTVLVLQIYTPSFGIVRLALEIWLGIELYTVILRLSALIRFFTHFSPFYVYPLIRQTRLLGGNDLELFGWVDVNWNCIRLF